MSEITNDQDIIDSRDIDARIQELEDDREATADAWDGEAQQSVVLEEWDADYGEELSALNSVKDECRSGEWQYGVALIRDSYFTEFAEQEAKDLDLIKENQSWPNNHIDWESAADELKQDYTSVNFSGVDYWVRA